MTMMLLEWVATSVFLILTVLLLRWVFGKRVSARLRYALWAVVLVRLLVPVQLFTSPLAGTHIFTETRTEQSVYHVTDEGVKKDGQDNIPVLDKPDSPAIAAPNLPQAPSVPDVPNPPAAPDLAEAPAWLGWIWLGGSAALALVLAASNLRFARRLRRSRIPVEGADCPLAVYAAAGLPSPCLFGLARPAVYVTPEAAADPAMLRHVIAHEYTHFRHGDHIWSLLRCAALAAHWWNPLVWLAVALSRRDGELACDEGALRRLGDGERLAYGNTLLALVTAKPGPSELLCFATTMAGDKKSLKERVSRIACAPKRILWAAVAVVLVTVLACVCAFGQAAEEPDAVWPYDVSELVYVRDEGGFGGDFTVQLNQDGSFTYYEGLLSSYIGRGTWSRDGDVICLADKGLEGSVGIQNYYFRQDGDDLIFLAENSAEFMYVDVADGERFSLKPSDPAAEDWYRNRSADTLPQTDLNRNGVPETLQVSGTSEKMVLEVREDGELIFSEEAYHAHAGYNAVFLCTLDGEDYLLRYNPYSAQGGCEYSYQLFTLSADGEEQTVRENSIEFFIDCVSPVAYSEPFVNSFQPEKIAAFMDEINGLLANSVQLINSDSELLATFQEEGRLYDSLYWMDSDPSKSLLENLRDYQAGMERGVEYRYWLTLMGYSDFTLRQFGMDSENGAERSANISDVPAALDPNDSSMKLWNFAVVDMDGDGVNEVLVYGCGVSGDRSGYLLLHQVDGRVYGLAIDYTAGGKQWFLNLKTDGTYIRQDPLGTDWMSIEKMVTIGQWYVFDDLADASSSDHGEYDSFEVNHQTATQAEFEAVMAAQNAKPDAEWYDFTEENINVVFRS